MSQKQRATIRCDTLQKCRFVNIPRDLSRARRDVTVVKNFPVIHLALLQYNCCGNGSRPLPAIRHIRFDCTPRQATYLWVFALRAGPATLGLPSMPGQTSRILLIEGDRTLLEITAFRLELLGYEVITLDTAERGLDWLRDQLPTLVIVDHVLPGIDGIEFINRLSNDTRTSEIPIMFLSTNGDLEDVQKAYNAGADEYLVIPYDPIVLEAKVERLASAITQSA
jgi:CheY-like chemotaxis protein